jgi:peptidyl-tRNA hydrolase, PTH1 family
VKAKALEPAMTLRLIAGLGNPGSEYARTRHNAGFWFIEQLAADLSERFLLESKLQAEVCKARLGGDSVLLVKPLTFMNRSGQCLSAILRYYKIEADQMLVAHDELDLPTGTARLKFDGGHGGQNGLRDIIAHLGHARFHRLRIGIGHPGNKDQVTPWVLGQPGKQDAELMNDSIAKALTAVPIMFDKGMGEAMKFLNSK